VTDLVVYVVAKAPRAGAVKTRLVPPLTPEEAAALARAFLLDTLALARAARGVEVRAVCRDAADAAAVRAIGGADLQVLCQHTPGLGGALEECFAHGLADGFGAVAVLGSDSPTLPSAIVEQTFAALDRADVAIGPTDDGGYYVLAARAVHPTLFREMVWSTDRVFGETVARCTAANLRVATLPRWYDVDTPDDLDRLRAELGAGRAERAPSTRSVLAGALDPLEVRG
jgi:uncharacterized protein